VSLVRPSSALYLFLYAQTISPKQPVSFVRRRNESVSGDLSSAVYRRQKGQRSIFVRIYSDRPHNCGPAAAQRRFFPQPEFCSLGIQFRDALLHHEPGKYCSTWDEPFYAAENGDDLVGGDQNGDSCFAGVAVL